MPGFDPFVRSGEEGCVGIDRVLLNLNLKKRESPEVGGAVVGVETVGVVALPDSGAVVELRGGDSNDPFLVSPSSKLGRPDGCMGVFRPDAEG